MEGTGQSGWQRGRRVYSCARVHMCVEASGWQVQDSHPRLSSSKSCSFCYDTTHRLDSRSVKMPQQPPPPGQSPQAPLSAQGRRVPITEAPAHCPSFCPNQLPMPSLVPSLPCGGTSSCFSKAVEERTTQILSSSGPGSRGEGSAAGVPTAHGIPQHWTQQWL